MNQMFLLMIGVLGVAGIGSLLSSDDDDELEPLPDDPIRGRDVIDGSADDERRAPREGARGGGLLRIEPERREPRVGRHGSFRGRAPPRAGGRHRRLCRRDAGAMRRVNARATVTAA